MTMKERTVQEDLDHCAASYTTNNTMEKKSDTIHVLRVHTAYCKCQNYGLTSAGRGHIKTKYMHGMCTA